MRKSFKLVLAVTVTCLIFAGIGSLSAQDKTYVLHFNTTSGPESQLVAAMNKFAEIVGVLSGGKIDVRVAHSGMLGDQKTALLGVMKGSLEMSSDGSPSWFADMADYPEIGVLEVAYLYRDIDHMYRVLNGPIGQGFWDNLAKRSKIRVLDTWYFGTRELSLTKKAGPARTPADLKGMKLRWPNAEAWLDVGRAMGANPTPLGFGEVYMALKTGTIDGQDNPIPTSYEEKFLTDHMIGYINPVINEDLWQGMPASYRVYIKKAMEVARFYMNEAVLEQEATLLGKAQKEYGIEVIIPDKKAFMENAQRYYAMPKFDARWGKGMYAKIQAE
jgi:tripartite ATP-independent transporter DctP family solute receptor